MRKSFLFPFLGKIKRYFRLSPFLAEDSHHYKITVFIVIVICFFQYAFLLEADCPVEFQRICIQTYLQMSNWRD